VKRVLLFAVVTALSIAGLAQAKGGPITKQNGSSPVLMFTSICAVPGDFADWLCGGDVTKYTEIDGKLTAVQPKSGQYNLKFTFDNLTPGAPYKLLATRDAVRFGGTWVEVGTGVADEGGSLQFKLETDSPGGLGFDLNRAGDGVTVLTTWWSGQELVVNDDGTLSPAS
jgi:hypothetical protein